MSREEAAALLALQIADDRLEAARAEVRALEERIASDPELDHAAARSEQLADEQRRAEAGVAAADLDVSAVRDRSRVVEKQLFGGSVRNPQDLLVLQRELEELRARRSALEETELELMERAEAATALRRAADQALATHRARRAASAGPDAERLRVASDRLAAARAERAAASAALPEGHRILYGRVAARRRPAVVRLNGDSCGGCKLPLGTGEARAVRSGRALIQCSSCDRILAP